MVEAKASFNLDMANAEKSKSYMVSRRLSQEKGNLKRDIGKLERQLIAEKKTLSDKKD